ncbi:YcgN family cysteine cluster protein [Shewanella marinintestina]|uniref:YcgN family cysteine cluster protein n=1 Tax=Shewanella marinintestina TaxID=190305 RepID=UPI002010451B|nr:YcgN family cysteine cluster protein [Shewanella marinintestina]MCL1144730.1 YcgN family cysteine cluster protein [Shewanella marinintestina]
MAFWNEKNLAQMSTEEWESLCDGCGKCCLNKLIDDETEELYYTNAACQLLDNKAGHCTNYEQRFKFVPSCTKVTVDNIDSLTWLPDSCAYRRLFMGRELPTWHPLRTGSKEAMILAGMSVAGKVTCETKVRDIEDHIVLWPMKDIE